MYTLVVHPKEGAGSESARVIAELPDRKEGTLRQYLSNETVVFELHAFGISQGREVYMLLENSGTVTTYPEAFAHFQRYVDDTWEDKAREIFAEVLSKELGTVVDVTTSPPGILAELRAGMDENVELEWARPLVEMVNALPERYQNFHSLVVEGNTLKLVRDYGEAGGLWNSWTFKDITEAVALGKFLSGLEQALQNFRQEMLNHEFEKFLDDIELIAYYS